MTITPEPSPPPKTRLRHLEHCLWPALLAVGLVMTWITRDPALAITSTLFAAIGFLVALILKHGFAEWFKCRAGLEYPGLRKGVDDEGDKIRPHVQGEKVLDLACGNNKTVPYAVGVDRVPNGESIKNLNAESKTDVVADVEQDMPFEKGSQDTIIARHILEHTLDPIRTLKHWASYLRPCGTLIIAVPDERQFGSISLNPEHVHAFTPDSMASFAEAAGLVMEGFETTSSASFVSILKKPEKRCSCHPLTALETSGSKS